MIKGNFMIPPTQSVTGYLGERGSSYKSNKGAFSVKEVKTSTSDFDIELDINVKIKNGKQVQKEDSSTLFEEYILNRDYKKLR